jgi:very-short-patch-repair endonuclease
MGTGAAGFSRSAPLEHLPKPFAIDDLVVMGDGLLRRKEPLTSVDEMRAAVARRAGRPGHRSLAQALDLIRPNTDSARETMLRLVLVRAGLPEPKVNVPICNEMGAVIAHGDLAFVSHRVLVEYDGGHHRTDERQYNIDIDRLDSIMELGWRVIRVNKASMQNEAQLVMKIRHALEQRQ